MIERWETTVRYSDVNEMLELQDALIEIADTGSADALYSVRHGLARVPRTVRIANVAVPSTPTNGVCWYRLDTDDPWTSETLTLRFNVANARVLLEVA